MRQVPISVKGIAWTTAGLLLIAVFALSGALITNAVAFPSAPSDTFFSQGNNSQPPSQVYQPVSTPTPLPIPTPTPLPPSPTPQPVIPTSTASTDPAAIDLATTRSNQAWLASMSCACDNGLEAVKTGSNLASTYAQIASLKRLGEHWTYRSHSLSVDSIHTSQGTVTARVTKAEDGLVERGGTVVRHCSGSYRVQYTLTHTEGAWKVSAATVLGGGQNCINGR